LRSWPFLFSVGRDEEPTGSQNCLEQFWTALAGPAGVSYMDVANKSSCCLHMLFKGRQFVFYKRT